MAMLWLCYMRLWQGYVMVMLHEVMAWLCYGCYMRLWHGYVMVMLHEVIAWLCYGYVT